jgi:hypothetical protein
VETADVVEEEVTAVVATVEEGEVTAGEVATAVVEEEET